MALVPPPVELPLAALARPDCRDFLLRALGERWEIDARDALEIDALLASLGSGPFTVCAAVHHGNFPTLEYLAFALRAHGHRTLGVYLQTPPPAHTFDRSYGCRGSLARLWYLLHRLPPGVLYLQAHGRWCYLGQLAQAAAPQRRVYQEVYDWMDLFVPPEDEQLFIQAGLFSAGELALNRHAEAHVRTASAGFVYKGGGPAMERLLARATAPAVQIFPCPPRAWQRRPQAPPAGPWQLVHTGQLKSRTTSRVVFGDLHYLPVIRTFTAQGMQVTAFASSTADEAGFRALYADYLDEAASNPRFRLEHNRPVRTLIEQLRGRYHYGLLTYHHDEDVRVGRDHLAAAVASKLFTYLAAGLPVLVSSEAVYMSELVRRLGIGLVLERADLPRLQQILAGVDHPRQQAAVAAAQEQFCIERFIPRILELFAGPTPP
jgi:hypothetical protein